MIVFRMGSGVLFVLDFGSGLLVCTWIDLEVPQGILVLHGLIFGLSRRSVSVYLGLWMARRCGQAGSSFAVGHSILRST